MMMKMMMMHHHLGAGAGGLRSEANTSRLREEKERPQ